MTLALLGYAAAVAVVAPRLLSSGWVRRSPRLAVMLWHTSGLSVLCAVVFAGVSCTTSAGFLSRCLAALVGSGEVGAALATAAGLAVPALVLARVGFVAARVARARRAHRRRHLDLLTLVGRPDRVLGATVIAHQDPAAYCVAGGPVVLSSGAFVTLDRSQLDAVIAHERAHLASRHHMLVAWAQTLAKAFPAAPLFRAIEPATVNLVELIADDVAARRASRAALASALAALAGGASPAATLGATGGQALARLQRLLAPPLPLSLLARVVVTSAAMSMLVLPATMAAAPAVLTAGLIACPYVGG